MLSFVGWGVDFHQRRWECPPLRRASRYSIRVTQGSILMHFRLSSACFQFATIELK